MTKTLFLKAYAAELATLPWASDPAKLQRFLVSCSDTLCGANTWNHDGPACTAAWRRIGGKGKPTLSALRALPD